MAYKSYKNEVLAALKSAIGRGLDAIGDSCVGHAQNLAPVDTGNLRASITHERDGEYTEVVGPSDSAAPIKSVYYAKFVELGTRHMNAQPFLNPALNDYASEYVSIMREELN